MKGDPEAKTIIEHNKHNYDSLARKDFETYEKLKEIQNQVDLTEEKNKKLLSKDTNDNYIN